MKANGQIVKHVLCVMVLLVLSQKVCSAPPEQKDWQALSKTGDHVGALRALDSARLEIVKKFVADLKRLLPDRLLSLKAGDPHDEMAYTEIGIQQTYTSEKAEIRVVLEVPTVNIDQMARSHDSCIQTVKASLLKGNDPKAQEEYLMLQRFAAQLQCRGVFAARPQLLAYLSNGATITISAMTDMSREEFYTFVDALPIRKIDQVIAGNSADEK